MGISQKAKNLGPNSVYPDQVWSSTTTSTTIRQNFTQSEVDAGATAINSHTRTRVATTANITLSGAQTIDGVTLSDGDRILVKDQAAATENGIRAPLSTGAYTREDDVIQAGMLVSVLAGTANGDKLFVCTNNDDPIIDTDPIAFALVGGIDGSGTANTVPKFSDADTLTDSAITDNGTTVSIGDEVIVTISPTGAAKTIAISGDAAQTDDVLYVTTTGTGRSAHIRRDSASATEPVTLIHQVNASDTQNAVRITQNGSGAGLYSTSTSGNAVWGDATSGIGVLGRSDTGEAIYGYSNGASRTKAIAKFWSDNASASGDVVEVLQDGTGAGVGVIALSGNAIEASATTGDAVRATTTGSGIGVYAESGTAESLYVYRNNSAAILPTAYIHQDHASNNQHALQVRQDGSGDIINATQGGTERFVVEDGGQTGIFPTGTGTALRIDATDTTGTNGDLHVTKSGSWGICYFDVASGTATHGFQYLFRRARGNITTPTSVSNGDQIGGFLFRAHNGSGYQQRAGILAYVDGAVSGTTVPTGFVFYTGTTALTERMRLTSAGDIGIGTSTPSTLGKVAIDASNITSALSVSQQSTGKIISARDVTTEVFSVEDGGNTYMQAGRRINTRTLTTSPTTLNATDDLVCVDTSTVTHTITLPTPTAGRKITIKDSAGNAAARNITINDSGTELIDGAATQTITTNYGSLDLVYNGSTWVII